MENEKASAVVNLTKKGQALLAIADERGSLRALFREVSANDLLDAARRDEEFDQLAIPVIRVR